jgi:uncharacterized membrane protein
MRRTFFVTLYLVSALCVVREDTTQSICDWINVLTDESK